MKHLILYAEDDRDMAELFIDDLHVAGYDVKWGEDGVQTLELYKEFAPDLVLLDVKMPKLDGFQVAREIRRKDMHTPIAFLTSLLDTQDAIKAIELGACDYFRKEVDDQDELFAKIRGMIRRHPVSRNPVIQITPDTSLNKAESVVTCCGKSVKLLSRECEILHTLALNKNQKTDREWLVSQLWDDNDNRHNYMNKAITKLRNAISDDPHIQITATRGDGIMLEVSK